GSGYSQAIAPFTNRSFWGVDSDAAVFRDFILRYLAVNNRAGSAKYLYGESYGGPRTAVLARRLQEAGVLLDGLVLQSPALDYNSNCG
ncbi:peptidase S1, partial [Acinetobacter baumannii]